MVKKILFAVVGAFISASSSFCMPPMEAKLLSCVSKWCELRKNFEPLNFSIDPYKDKLREEIGDDKPAIEAFDLFHQCKFSDLVDYWDLNNSNMKSENAERFKEMLLVSAAIIERQVYDGFTLRGREPECPSVLKIISIVGGDRTAVTWKTIKYPQFCFEMMFSLTVDIASWSIGTRKHCTPPKLAQSCMSICSDLCYSLNWPIKEDEVYLTNIFPCIEDAFGNCSLENIWPNWNLDLFPVPYGISVSRLGRSKTIE
ncbi:hypothetical protein FACS189472_05250 [Alphaproteobacteria bacterium]|nr:hypothetical protein FACS189472_05250 [Alphaproteobacteria bacterium]